MQTKRLTTKPTHEVIAAIQSLDLTSVKIRMMDAELGEGWSQEYADSIEAAYKAFLTMVTKDQHRAEEIKLSKDVDEFWHTHILDTMKYADDCEAVFGRYLHHNPKVGEAAEGAAMCNVAGGPDTAAMCNVAVRSERAAMCNVAIRSEKAAMCNVAIRSEKAAMCNVTIRSEKAAMCNVAVRPEGTAMCNVAVRSESAAMCNVAVPSETKAMCNVAVRSASAAMCNVAVLADAAAMCNVAIRS